MEHHQNKSSVIKYSKKTMRMVCPLCDGQGNIYHAKILDLGIIIKICDECEACWNQDQIVSIKNFKRLTPFLEEHGLTYKNATIEDLEYVEDQDIHC